MTIASGQPIASADILVFRRIQTGTASISFTTQTSFSQAITFPSAFSVAPNVSVNINNLAGVTGGWNGRAGAVSTTGATLLLFGPSATWGSVPVQWTAVSNSTPPA